MDQNLVYAKTPTGDEAVRQSTRVVQRSLRMVLVQVDGRLSVADLCTKMGDPRLVEDALSELEEGGFIAPSSEALSAWLDGRMRLRQMRAAQEASGLSSVDAESVEGSHYIDGDPESGLGKGANFTAFGKPVLPAAQAHSGAPAVAVAVPAEESESPRSTVKFLLIALALLTILLVAAYFLFPYNRFKGDFESELRKIFQVGVSIGDVRPRLLPKPALVLADVRVGSGDDGSIDEIRITSLSGLIGGHLDIERIEIVGARVAADRLQALPMLGAPATAGASKVRLHRIGLERLVVTAGQLKLGDLKGEILLAQDGRIENLSLQTVDRSLRIGLQVTPQGPVFSFEGLAWRPIDDFPLTLDSLQAKVLLLKGGLVVQQFDANALGGSLQGGWLIDWASGLAMTGEATFERLDARRVTSIFASSLSFEGLMTGSMQLRGGGSDWQTLWAGVGVQSDLTVMRGVFNGVDLGEAARRGPGSFVRAGSTKFDRMTLKLAVDRRQIVGRDVVMSAGLFNASGSFVASRERAVESTMLVSMHTSVSSLTIPVKVTGTLPNLQAAAIR